MERLGGFQNHEGFSGEMVGWPDASFHLELTICSAHPVTPAPTKEDLLAIYLPAETDFSDQAARMLQAGWSPVQPFNPYWEANGRAFADADGYQVVLVAHAWPGGTSSIVEKP